MKYKTDYIIDAILALLAGYKDLSSGNQPSKQDLHSFKYLLGQTIRAYIIPANQIHVSVGASQRWKKLTSASIFKFTYDEFVTCDVLQTSVPCNFYNGSQKNGTPTQINPGDRFRFNNMFHVDHVIPVSLILNELIGLTAPCAQQVKNTLDKMHLCYILKDEDRKLGRTKSRTTNFQQTIKNVYEPNKVFIYELQVGTKFDSFAKQILDCKIGNDLAQKIANNENFIIQGAVAIGKEYITEIANKYGYITIEMPLLSVNQPEWFEGLPYKGGLAMPEWFYEMSEHPDQKYLLFFDFMDRVSDTMQDVLRRILYEHKLGGKVLDNFIVGAARCHLEQYKHQSTLAPDILNAFGSPLIYRD